jgi:hypothetical protein
VVSDSLIALRTVDTWYPARRAAGTTAALKNLDLVEACAEALAALRARVASVTLTHVRGHQPPPRANPVVHARWPLIHATAALHHRGNELADAWASVALALDVDDGVVVSRAETL